MPGQVAVDAGMVSATISYIGCEVHMRGPVHWVREVERGSRPYFSVRLGERPPEARSFDMLLSSDISTHASLRDVAECHGIRVALHAGNSGVMAQTANATIVHDAGTGMVAQVGESSVTLYPDVTRPDCDQTILKLVRGILVAQAVASGCIFAHAAAVCLQGLNILLVGGKGSGKTSFATSMLRGRPEAGGLITNDRCVIGKDGAVWGVPKGVALSPDCLPDAPELRDLQPDRVLPSGKLLFWPDRFAASLGCRVSAGGPIHGVLGPRLDLGAEGVSVRELCGQGKEDRVSAWSEAITGDLDDVHPEWLTNLIGLPPIHDASAAERVRSRLRQIPCFEATGNPWRENWLTPLLICRDLTERQV